eukprot:gene19667-23552_t
MTIEEELDQLRRRYYRNEHDSGYVVKEYNDLPEYQRKKKQKADLDHYHSKEAVHYMGSQLDKALEILERNIDVLLSLEETEIVEIDEDEEDLEFYLENQEQYTQRLLKQGIEIEFEVEDEENSDEEEQLEHSLDEIAEDFNRTLEYAFKHYGGTIETEEKTDEEIEEIEEETNEEIEDIDQEQEQETDEEIEEETEEDVLSEQYSFQYGDHEEEEDEEEKRRTNEYSKKRYGVDVDAIASPLNNTPVEEVVLEDNLDLDQKIDQLLLVDKSKENAIVARYELLTLNLAHIWTLRPGEWLSDEVINFKMALLDARRNEEQSVDYPRCYFFSTFFYPKLLDFYDLVKRWTKNVDIFSYQKIIIPVHVGHNHWTLAIINLKDQRLEYFDSLLHENNPCLEVCIDRHDGSLIA